MSRARITGYGRDVLPADITKIWGAVTPIGEEEGLRLAAAELRDLHKERRFQGAHLTPSSASSAEARLDCWRALSHLRDTRGDGLRCGVLLYTGESTVPLGDRIFAVPISGLWS